MTDASEDDYVEILGLDNGQKGSLIDVVYEAATNRYFAPPLQYDITKPVNWEGPVAAILDTGVLMHHPAIRAVLVESVDFTGEGPEDKNGHGTVVTLLTMKHQTDLVGYIAPPPLLNVKIVDSKGRGDKRWLIAAFDWLTEWSQKNNNVVIANLSAGLYHRRFGILSCNGTCDICAAAKRAAEAGIYLCMAAGNEGPDKVPCPQRGALLERFQGIVTGAFDPTTGEMKKYSGKAHIVASDDPGMWYEISSSATEKGQP